MVTKLDRLARSLPDAHAIADELTARQISLRLGGSVYDPTDAVGRLLFNVLAMVAESDLIRLRTREGMKVAKAKGRLRGKQPKLNRKEEPTSCRWCTAASTAPSRSPSSSASAAPPSTAPSNAKGSPRRPTSRRRQQGAERSRRRPSRIRHPTGMPAPPALRLAGHPPVTVPALGSVE